MGLDDFARRFPERHIEVGIAEQNLLTVAAGLAAQGRPVIAASYAAFASMRALEQFRTFICYPRLPVTVAAGLSGLSAGIEGVAHLALEDIGLLRCVPGVTILNPADAVATTQATREAVGTRGPAYLRLGRDDTPVVFGADYSLSVGRGRYLLRDGCDAALLTSGLILPDVLDAASRLRSRGVRCTVAEFATLKPFDSAMVREIAERAECIFTIEEHSVIGGLGGAVLEALALNPTAAVHRIGIEDRFLESGTPGELRAKYGLTPGAIVDRVIAAVPRTFSARAAGRRPRIAVRRRA
jgi:transketolase